MPPSHGSVPAVLKTLESAPAKLKVIFPGDKAISEAGAFLPRAAAAAGPQIFVAPGTSSPTGTFLALCLDLDAPLPSFPFMSPIAHWIQTDLVAQTAGVGADGFAQLKPASGKERTVAPYRGPRPPPGSAPHRYIFLVWAQPDGVTYESVREALGVSGDAQLGLWPRIRWDEDAFEKKVGLGEVLASNYYVSN